MTPGYSSITHRYEEPTIPPSVIKKKKELDTKNAFIKGAKKFLIKYKQLNSTWDFIKTKETDIYPIRRNDYEFPSNRIMNLFKSKTRSKSIIASVISARKSHRTAYRSNYSPLDIKRLKGQRCSNENGNSPSIRSENEEFVRSKKCLRAKIYNRRKLDMNSVGELENKAYLPFNDLIKKIMCKRKSDESCVDNRFDWINNIVESKTLNKSYHKDAVLPSGSNMIGSTLSELHKANKFEFHKRKGITEFMFQLQHNDKRSSGDSYERIMRSTCKPSHIVNGKFTFYANTSKIK